MKIQLLVLLAIFTVVWACGPSRPNPDDFRSSKASPSPAVTNKASTTANSSSTTSPGATNSPTPTPTTKPTSPSGPAPAQAKAPIRTLANATEIANAQAQFTSACAGCHNAGLSPKKGATLTMINSGGSGTIAAHASIVGANTWPKDTADTTDDGIDSAALKASAMVEYLK